MPSAAFIAVVPALVAQAAPVDAVPAEPASRALWWAALALFGLLYLLLALAVGARLVVGRLAAERLADESGLHDPLSPGSRSWAALLLVRSLSLCAAVLAAALGPLREHALLAGSVAGVTVALGGRLLEALVSPRWPQQILAASAGLLRLVDLLFGPLLAPLARAHERLLEAGRRERAEDDDEDAREEQLEEYIRDAEAEGILEEEESDLLREIVDASEVTVKEVMTPRVEIVAVDASATLGDAAAVFTESRHSRLLVHDGGLDRIVGVLPVRDLLPYLRPAGEPVEVRSLMRQVPHVPAQKRVLELLRELQEERQQIAVVVDEYGGTAGIVSLEDLVEEIVGEIRDEHESEEDEIRLDAGGALLVDGLVPVGELEERIDREISDDDVETVGGLVFSRLGRMPRMGDAVDVAPGVRLEVIKLRGRRIETVRVTVAAQGGTDEDATPRRHPAERTGAHDDTAARAERDAKRR